MNVISVYSECGVTLPGLITGRTLGLLTGRCRQKHANTKIKQGSFLWGTTLACFSLFLFQQFVHHTNHIFRWVSSGSVPILNCADRDAEPSGKSCLGDIERLTKLLNHRFSLLLVWVIRIKYLSGSSFYLIRHAQAPALFLPNRKCIHHERKHHE